MSSAAIVAFDVIPEAAQWRVMASLRARPGEAGRDPESRQPEQARRRRRGRLRMTALE
jgi:hypothetical protein